MGTARGSVIWPESLFRSGSLGPVSARQPVAPCSSLGFQRLVRARLSLELGLLGGGQISA